MINGYIFGNVPGLEMCVGDRVDWHLFGMGSETDLHSSMYLVYLTLLCLCNVSLVFASLITTGRGVALRSLNLVVNS
jgi:hypothetical protein